MGFRYEPHQYKLTFEDSELKGLEIVTNSVTLAEYNAINNDEKMALLFADKLISWNLEDDDGPVPATYEALQKQEFPFVRQLLERWFQELTGVSRPLPQNLNGGQRSEEASLGMAPSSQSLTS